MSILERCESRGGKPVIWLAVHSTEGDGTAQDLRDASWWEGSSHAINDATGTLLTPAQGCVPYDQAAWTIRGGNHYSDNIEQVGWAKWTTADWLARPLLLEGTARWLAERSKARGIPLVRLGPADILAHKPGVIGHGDYTVATKDGTHTDPGPGYPWQFVLDRATALRDGGDELTDEQAKQLAAVYAALTTTLPSRAYAGAPGKDSLFGYAINADGFGWRAENKLFPAVQAKLAELEAKIATVSTGGVDYDQLAAKVADLLAKRLAS